MLNNAQIELGLLLRTLSVPVSQHTQTVRIVHLVKQRASLPYHFYWSPNTKGPDSASVRDDLAALLQTDADLELNGWKLSPDFEPLVEPCQKFLSDSDVQEKPELIDIASCTTLIRQTYGLSLDDDKYIHSILTRWDKDVDLQDIRLSASKIRKYRVI